MYFHGTDHQSARNISTVRGIYLNAGRPRHDFSSGKGFYLSNNLWDSFHWANYTATKPVILVFKTNRYVFDASNKLDPFDSETRWQDIVYTFRSRKGTAKMRRNLNAYDVIEGPRARVKTGESPSKIVIERIPSSHQICLISNEFANIFENTLHSVIFLDTPFVNLL